MVPSLIARVDGVDGLPQPVAPERVWPHPTISAKRRGDARRRRERDARQSAVVAHARLPRWARQLLAVEEQERLEIRAELAKAGLL